MTDAASWMNLEKIVKWKKLDTRNHISYDSIYMTCLEKASYQIQKTSDCLGVGMGINHKWSCRIFLSGYKFSQIDWWWWHEKYTSVKLLKKVIIKNDSWVSTDFFHITTIIILCFTSSSLAFKNTLNLHCFLIVSWGSSCLGMANLWLSYFSKSTIHTPTK